MQTGAIIETWRKRLARMGVRQVQLDHRHSRGRDRVAQRDGRVGIGTRVQDHAVGAGSRRVQRIDQRAFVIALLESHRDAEITGQRPAGGFDVGESVTAVDVRLARAEQVQVRSVQNEDVHDVVFLRRAV